MRDLLSPRVVITLETSAKEVTDMIIAFPESSSRNDSSEILFWISYASLSSKHALKRIMEQETIHILIGNADDITSLITAGFCILAILLSVFLCYLACRKRKPYYDNYDLGSSQPTTRTEDTSSSNNTAPNRQSSNYSSPARAAVTTRSNPLYSSHRSVDVERPVDNIPPTMNNINYDVPNVDNRLGGTRPDTLAEKNERNTAGRDRGISPQLNKQASDYKDPRRNRRVGAARDNDGYLSDEMIGVRSDSESVL